MQLDIRLTFTRGVPGSLVLPVFSSVEGSGKLRHERQEGHFDEELTSFLDEINHSGAPGEAASLPRPTRKPRRIFLVGVGEGDPSGWRAFGAAVTRSAAKETSVTVEVPADVSGDCLRALIEGLRMAAYHYREVPLPEGRAPKLRRVNLDGPTDAEALEAGTVTAEVTLLARDWVNTHSARKSPQWLAAQMERAAGSTAGIKTRIRDTEELTREGFGGILAVGSGSSRPPRLVEMTWAPRGAKRHIVLVGKGITFDTGGISIKPASGMLLMRKDMGGAAAVIGALIGAARLKLPIAVTALAPLAENSVGASSFRPGDIVRHYGGKTSEILNTDAEGRVVLADALAYAVRRLRPDVLIDLATLTG
ncbi:MAG: leucyl aminopeptidase family protein, partial [Longispora sp.]|nr:leucyl aminopeptidase family protein [Longispora sp. (in: high G+C Gram-positive bacteria)]